jgi:3-dehydroquinate dehydratase / shikimate dehydrogenase
MVTMTSPTTTNSTSSLLCIVISGPTLNEAREQVRKACTNADAVEFRLDQFQFSQIHAIKSLKDSSTVPVIFTLRKRTQGGEYTGDEQERLDQIRQLASLEPSYFDLEYDVDEDLYDELLSISPDTQIISSFHDFSGAPIDLKSVLEVMKQVPASIYKIATMANSTIDALKMLRFVKENTKRSVRIIGICMGEHGHSTRILGPIFGNAIVYATLSEGLKVAPGQLTAEELITRYNYKSINKETAVLGLIGDPVKKSPSHNTHNVVIRQMGLNAIYSKFLVHPSDLHEFLELAKRLEFKGLSVTMPLKEYVTKELSEPSKDADTIGAINTLKFDQKKVEGYNTDGIGALDALEDVLPVLGKKIVILGAGGAAKAIAWVAKERGAKLIILNRSTVKAEELATQVGAKYGALSEFPNIAAEGYDVLINCTSLGMFADQPKLPIDCGEMLDEKIVMDIIPGHEPTQFIEEARKKRCVTIQGNEMLMQQAVKQFKNWFGDSLPTKDLKQAFREAFEA